MRRPLATLGLVLLSLSGCSLALGLPDTKPEEDQTACMDGIDNDIDGETDCADPGCHDLCGGGVGDPPSVAGCFRDDTLGLVFSLGQIGPTTTPHARCEPDGVSPRPACATDERWLPGAEACAAPGGACVVEDWPADAADAQHVRAGATGGDGSAEQPWGTIAEALDALAASPTGARVVLLWEGEHEAPPTLSDVVELRGVCPARTQLRGAIRTDAPITLTDLTLGVDDGLALDVRADVVARGVTVDGEIAVHGGSLTLEDGWVRTGEGVAIDVDGGGRLAITATVVDAHEIGVRVSEGELSAHAVAILGSSEEGLSLGSGARARDAAGIVVEPVSGVGAVIGCVDDTDPAVRCAEIDDLVVRGTGSPSRLVGLQVHGANARLRRTYVAHTRGAGIEVLDASLTLEDSWIESTENVSVTDPSGNGVQVGAGGDLRATRVFIWNFARDGVRLEDGGRATLGNVEIAGSPHGQLVGSCVQAGPDGGLSATGFTLSTCGLCGLRLEPGVAPLLLSDGAIVDNFHGTCLSGGASYPLDVLTTFVLYRGNERGNVFRLP